MGINIITLLLGFLLLSLSTNGKSDEEPDVEKSPEMPQFEDGECVQATSQCAWNGCGGEKNLVWMYASCEYNCTEVTQEIIDGDLRVHLGNQLSWYQIKDATDDVFNNQIQCCICLIENKHTLSSFQIFWVVTCSIVGAVVLLWIMIKFVKCCRRVKLQRKNSSPTQLRMMEHGGQGGSSSRDDGQVNTPLLQTRQYEEFEVAV